MIQRHWRGTARTEHAQQYIEHLRTETFPQLAALPGFIDASILRRPQAGGVEFLIITRWDSLESIRRFAGDDAERAVVPDKVQAMMLSYDSVAIHYESVS